MNRDRGRDAAERFAERRRREDAAPRLRAVVPTLSVCRLELAERRQDAVTAEVSHTRRIVVEHAPALFIVPCTDPACSDGGHDLTNAIIPGLREGKTRIEGEDTCHGYKVSTSCGRVLHFSVFAEYRTP